MSNETLLDYGVGTGVDASLLAADNLTEQPMLSSRAGYGLANIGRRRLIGSQVDTANNSMSRVAAALSSSLRSPELDSTLKSDLDNAARHAGQLVKSLRGIKKTLFPTAAKAESKADAPEKATQ